MNPDYKKFFNQCNILHNYCLVYLSKKCKEKVMKSDHCLKIKVLLLQESIFFLIHLFARDVLVIKKLEIETTKPTFIISVLKVDIIKVGLVFSISNFFITKTPLANNWRRKKIPSCSYSALYKKQNKN